MNYTLAKDYQANIGVLATSCIYALPEGGEPKEESQTRLIQVSETTAKIMNSSANRCGIFASVNGFPRIGSKQPRRKDNVGRVNAWFIESDELSKPEQLRLLQRSPLVPTMVVESKRSYHAYWVTCSPDLQEHISSWDRIVKRGLIPHFNADKKAADITRILRMPGYYHWKDHNDPFMVQRVWSTNAMYTIRQMLSAFPDRDEKARQERQFRKSIKMVPGVAGDFWDRVYHLDCEYALNKLSGSPHVGSETFSFRDNSDGTLQIVCDGKPTSCWIDIDKRIGSYEYGGPTIAQWLHWYHKDYAKVVDIINEVFPECRTAQLTLF